MTTIQFTDSKGVHRTETHVTDVIVTEKTYCRISVNWDDLSITKYDFDLNETYAELQKMLINKHILKVHIEKL